MKQKTIYSCHYQCLLVIQLVNRNNNELSIPTKTDDLVVLLFSLGDIKF